MLPQVPEPILPKACCMGCVYAGWPSKNLSLISADTFGPAEEILDFSIAFRWVPVLVSLTLPQFSHPALQLPAGSGSLLEITLPPPLGDRALSSESTDFLAWRGNRH